MTKDHMLADHTLLAAVYEVGSITSDFSKVDLSRFRSKVHDGRRHYLSNGYCLDVTFGAQEGILKFQGNHDGKAIGHSKIDYNKSKAFRRVC